jgi:PAS domain S-box-containing protein
MAMENRMPDVQYRLDAGRSKQTVEQTNRLLKAVSEIQLKFIRECDAHSRFEQALQVFLDLTNSAYGFIGTVHHDADGAPWLRSEAISNIAWDQASKELYDSSLPDGLQFRNLKTLFGESLRTGELLISNTPAEDDRRGGLPSGHPALTAFMAIPIRLDDHFIGLVGLANRPNGYDTDLAGWLEPLCTTCATLMTAAKNEEARQLAEMQADQRQDQLQTILDTVNARILYLDTEGRVVRHNLLSQKSTGLLSQDCVGKTVEEVGGRLDNAKLRHEQNLEVIRSGKHLLAQVVSYEEGGEVRWASIDKIPTFAADGQVDGLLICAYDISDLHSTAEALRQTESQLSLLLQKMPAVLWSVDKDHVFTMAVGKALEVLGRESQKLVGMTLEEYFGTDDSNSPRIARHLAALEGESIQYETDWNEHSFECRLEPIRDDAGKITGCLGVALDVTARVTSEREQRKTEEQWKAVVKNVPDNILVVGQKGEIRFLNHFKDGYDQREVLQTTIYDYQPPDSHEKVRDALRRVIDDGESVSLEIVGRGSPDEWRTYSCRFVPMTSSSDGPTALMIATDVTEERLARQAEAKHFGILKAITEGTSELIFAKDLESRPVFVNDAIAKVHGTTVEQMIGKAEDAWFSEASLKKTINDDQRIIRTGQSETYEEVLMLATGERNFLTTKCPWRDQDGNIVGVIGVAKDITEWKKTHNALHQSREHLRAIIESTPGCVKLVAQDGTLLEINAAGLRMSEADSAESIIGSHVFDLIATEYRSAFIRFHKRICSGHSGSMQFELVGLKGTRRWVETHAAPLQSGSDGNVVHLAITHDITAARAAEETIAAQHSQLIHVSRLSSMGQMVAVISHEITQPLAAIANFAAASTMLADQPTPDLKKLRAHLASITAQSARAGQILGRIRNFVKHSEDNRIDSDLVQLLADSLTLVRADLRSRRVIIQTDFPAQAAIAAVDPIQFQQVVVNLISNACDALESKPAENRRIWIRLTENESQIQIEIIDNGPGLLIDAEDQLFDPFYTSKANGMGMGLTICSDIIKSHFGTISADNAPNAGARFRITLPRVMKASNE